MNHKQVPADDSRQRTFTGHLNIYYDAVIACIRDAESILIFGPGEAKDELKKRLERNNLGGRIVGIETVDKMTDRQIAAKVRQRFPASVRELHRKGTSGPPEAGLDTYLKLSGYLGPAVENGLGEPSQRV